MRGGGRSGDAGGSYRSRLVAERTVAPCRDYAARRARRFAGLRETTMRLLASLALATLAAPLAAQAVPDVTRTYRVQQTVTLSDVPAGSKSVAWWIAIPDDDPCQQLLDLTVASAPGPWRIVREPDHG